MICKTSRLVIVAFLALAASFFLPINTHGQGVAINEIMSSNRNTLADEDGDFEDWIELYNNGSEPVNLEGWGLSDNLSRPFKWVFPEVIIEPEGYLLVWASGKDRKPEVGSWTEGISRDVYEDIPGATVASLINHPSFPNQPASSSMVTNLFEAPTNIGDNYGQRMHGWIKAPATGNYIFWIASDDNSKLYLSTDKLPGNQVLIAQVPGWTNSREWDKYPEQESVEVQLEVGKNYYIRALMKEADGGDNLAVGWRLPDNTLERPIGGNHLFWRGGELHTNFAISSSGEPIILTKPDGVTADEVPPQAIRTDISFGRWPNGHGEFFFHSAPTPGQPNESNGYSEVLEPPVFSHSPGFHPLNFNLSLSNPTPGVTIVYTLDGSTPDPNNLTGTSFQVKNSYPGSLQTTSYISYQYENSIPIVNRTSQMEVFSRMASTYDGAEFFPNNRTYKGTVVRAIAVKEGALPSTEIVGSFYISPNLQNRYTLPIISLSIQANYMWDYYTGIYVPGYIWDTEGYGGRNGGAAANYHQRGDEFEVPAYLEFFDGEATERALSQHVGVRVHGNWSRAHAMKTLRIYARNRYGEESLNYRMFPDQEYESYKRVMLRNSGNDWEYTMFRDAAIHAIVAPLGLDIQAYRPSIVFINGEYWGIHNIRERYDKHYIARTWGVDPENLDYLTADATVKEGDSYHYNAMIEYIQTNGVVADEHYEYVKTQMDIENFIDYQITNIYSRNTDWPGNNIDFWRLRTEGYLPDAPKGHDGRWRWMVFDTDFGFGIWGNDASHNTLSFATEAGNGGWPNPDWSTFLLRNLLANQEFKEQFINRFADQINTTFRSTRVVGIINQMRNALEPEMLEHINRWNRPWNYDYWHNDEVQKMITFANQRPSNQRDHIVQHFGLSGTFNLSLNVCDKNHGYIRVNSIPINESAEGVTTSVYPWSGVYFSGVPIELEAVAKPGYIFSHWEGIDAIEPLVNRSFTSSRSIKAHFREVISIHYWHFNDLPTDELESVEADHSLVDGALITYPGTGDGYMDRVNDGTLNNASEGVELGFGLRVRNPSSTRQMVINAPTTGYTSILLSYSTKRTTFGARNQVVQFRTTPTGSWQQIGDTVLVTEQWATHYFHLPESASKNPNLSFRILFTDEFASSESGNNRFDNIRIDGDPSDLPTVVTNSVRYETISSITATGTVPSDGGYTVTQRGLVWHSEDEPNLDNYLEYSTEGDGLGQFSTTITDVSLGVTYFVRAYATNEKGTEYGQVIEYTHKRVASIAGSFTVLSKAYDGTNNAQMDQNQIILSGVLPSDNVELINIKLLFDQAEVGESIPVLITAAQLAGSNANDYQLSIENAPTSSGNISKKELTLSGSFTAFSKEYDGSESATIGENNLVLTGTVEGENITLSSAIVAFDEALPSDEDITVRITNAYISGRNVINYTISLAGAPTAMARITPKSLIITGTFTARDKEYDGTTIATIQNHNLNVDGTIGDDSLDLVNPSAEFSHPNIGNSIAVLLVGAELVGSNSNNYRLSITDSPRASAVISHRALTIGGSFTVLNKEYDGSSYAVIDQNNLVLQGLVEADVITLINPIAAFAQSSVGANIVVTIVSADLSGSKAGNYMLSLDQGPSATASITQFLSNVDTHKHFSESFAAYPNPFGSHINLYGNGIVRVSITDLTGRTVLQLNARGVERIDTDHLMSGPYLVTLEIENGYQRVVRMVKL